MKEVHIFPWQRPFLPDLKEFIQRETKGRPGHAVIIVPHKRPARYISHLYSLDKKPSIIPKIVDFAELINIWNKNAVNDLHYSANILDQIALLRACLEEISENDPQLSSRLAGLNMANFLPWGMRLARLLDELPQHGVETFSIDNADEGSPIAGALLQALGKIDSVWQRSLREKNWSTAGLQYKIAREHVDRIPHIFTPSEKHYVFIAGFSALNATGNALFKKLWENGAYVCLHADPALVEGKNMHWTCTDQFAWLRKWKAKSVLVDPGQGEDDKKEPELSFFAAYDGHSQLEEMSRLLKKADEKNMNTALVLCDENLLMPVLHNLPDKNVNISMGYPLERTPLANLLKLVFTLQQKRDNTGAYYWRDLIDLFNSPFFKLLQSDETANKEHGKNRLAGFNEKLESLRHALRTGSRYVSTDKLIAILNSDARNDCNLLQESIGLLLEKPAEMRTTAQMADVLEEICNFFIKNTDEFRKQYPLDAEAAQRFLHNALPIFRNNAMSSIELNMVALKYIFDTLGGDERIPFEADPIVGLQILGMLETRLLHFDRVIFLDASDDILPGNTPEDPLLPDSLRSLLGLPDSHTREQVTAYNLYRLCACAKKAHFLWPEGISHSQLLSAKKTPSRFVEQLLWQAEEKAGKLIRAGEGFYRKASARITVSGNGTKSLDLDAALEERLQNLLAGNISASIIKDYLDCPVKFASKRLLGLFHIEEVNEADDPLKVGNCIHDTLKTFFDPAQNRDLSRERLMGIFNEKIKEYELKETLPPQSMIVLNINGPKQLEKLLGQYDHNTKIKYLEKKLNCRLKYAGEEYRLEGKVDRIDERNGKLYILDYKTGQVPKISNDLWLDEDLFSRLADYCRFPHKLAEKADIYFNELVNRIGDLQLPFYILLLMGDKSIGADEHGDVKIANAAYVELNDSCKEKPLFSKEISGNPELMRKALNNCETVVAFILQHMKHARAFSPHVASCPETCDFLQLCNSRC